MGGVGRCGQDGIAQDAAVGEGDAENGLEHARFVPALAVMRVERVVIQLGSEVRTVATGKLHCGDENTTQIA